MIPLCASNIILHDASQKKKKADLDSPARSVTLVAFTLCGIEGIATELEMPFGIDDSDLNLDLFCAEIRNEVRCFSHRDARVDLMESFAQVEHIIMRLPASLDEWEI